MSDDNEPISRKEFKELVNSCRELLEMLEEQGRKIKTKASHKEIGDVIQQNVEDHQRIDQDIQAISSDINGLKSEIRLLKETPQFGSIAAHLPSKLDLQLKNEIESMRLKLSELSRKIDASGP